MHTAPCLGAQTLQRGQACHRVSRKPMGALHKVSSRCRQGSKVGPATDVGGHDRKGRTEEGELVLERALVAAGCARLIRADQRPQPRQHRLAVGALHSSLSAICNVCAVPWEWICCARSTSSTIQSVSVFCPQVCELGLRTRHLPASKARTTLHLGKYVMSKRKNASWLHCCSPAAMDLRARLERVP